MSSHPYARRLAQDLFDALWLEDLFGFRAQCTFLPAANGATILDIALDGTRSLRWHGNATDGLRPFRVGKRAIALHVAARSVELDIIGVVDAMQTAHWWQERTNRFARFFRLAYRQTAFSAMHEHAILTRLTVGSDDLLCWEALSCLKDRPFHPLARAKDWAGSDSIAYAAETAVPFPLQWVALPRSQVRGAGNVGQPIADILLNRMQRDTLGATARRAGVHGEDWLWLPVHPWQWTQLKQDASPCVALCIDLGAESGAVIPSASLRSLAVIGCAGIHLKLSLSVNALGALRTLPPRYLHNGVLAAACLENLCLRDDWLAAHLLLCEEKEWWACRQNDALAAEPGELACMLRRYPALPGATLIPMAALPVMAGDGMLPAFEHLLGAEAGDEAAWILFGDIARALLELGLRCFAQGVMPELHGQNVLLAFRGQRIAGLVLRDHDTLRICRTLMQAQGLEAPNYVIDRSTPNTLELEQPRDLLAYLQTLAIEVNLYAILAALAERYDEEETRGWQIVRTELAACLTRVPLPDHIAAEARRLLLDEPYWPFKQVLAPLLGRASFGTGMPSAMGRLANPLLSIAS